MIISIYMGKFRTRPVVPSGQDSSILPARLAKSQGRICFIFPAHGASHIIREISAPLTGNKLKKQTKMVEHKLIFVHSCNFTDKGIICIP